MAMNATTLKAALKARLISDAGATDNAALDQLCEVLADEIINHITTNGEVDGSGNIT